MRDEIDPSRYEFKYALPLLRRTRLLELVGDNVIPDPHAGPMDLPFAPEALGYYVHSLYFDTPRLDDYMARLGERRVRDRLRLRTYGGPGEGQPLFIENKRKQVSRVVKSRELICTADEWLATPGPYPWLPWVQRLGGGARYAGDHFDRLVRLGGRGPVTVIHYAREIFVGRRHADTKLRLNMDYLVTVTCRPTIHDLYAPADKSLLPEDWMVLELKFDTDAPGWMRRVARELRLSAEPVSKFGLGVAHAWRADRPRELRYLTPRSVRPLLFPDQRRAQARPMFTPRPVGPPPEVTP